MPPSGVARAEENNLLQNAGFETESTDTPEAWARDIWVQTEGASYLGIAQNHARSGTVSAVVENTQPNHAKWVQTVQVEPDTDYLISGWVQVEQVGDGEVGATIFPLGVGGAFPHLTESDEQWKQLRFYGRTGPGQRELTIAAGIGGYGHLNTGKAYFDDLEVRKVPVLPEGATPLPLEQPTEPPAADSGEGGSPETESSQPATQVSVLPILLFSALFSVLFVFLVQKVIRRQADAFTPPKAEQVRAWFIWMLAGAFLLRIWIALTIQGFQTDMNTFMAWAQQAVDRGLGGFYSDDMFADYPPGYIYVLYALGFIQNLFSMDPGSSSSVLLFKTPSILADLITGFLIYKTAGRHIGGKTALALSALYLWNPAILINSAGWGQVDSFYVLFLLMALITLTERRFERSAVWLAIAALIKPQTFIFAPVWLIACFYYRDVKRISLSLLCGIGVFGLLALPFFWGNGGVTGIIDLYRTTLASYPYASVNAFNIYALFGQNWSSLENSWLFLTFRTWGLIAILGALVYTGFIFIRKKAHGRDLSNSYFIALALIAMLFVLGTKMHERYMFPALILSLFSFIHVKDRRLLALFTGFSLTQYVNTAYVLQYLNAGASPGTDGIVLLCSIANVVLLGYMLYLGFDIYIKKRIIPLTPWTEEEREREDKTLLANASGSMEPRRKARSASFLKRMKDGKWIGAILVIYLAVALFQLGATKAPETGWTPANPDQSFYVDFGETKKLEKVNFFSGVGGNGKFKLEFGTDAVNWGQAIEITQDVGYVFAWNSQAVETEARYAKFTAEETGFSLHEIAFYGEGERSPLSIAGIHGDGDETKSYERLFDEPKAAVYKPDYRNGTYFDEIYHARTAYEYLHGLPSYENTHPPLGKLLIAAGIQVFGLNPFGWRIVGTLLGAAMLPLIYAFAMHLFGKRKYAVTAAILFAAEFMHFTQTRIATIDVYGVFFILLMFYFMSRYISLNFNRDGVWKTLIPLFWAGLFFGIGVASKWIVLYGGAGLAIMLAVSLYARYREFAAAKRMLKTHKKPDTTETEQQPLPDDPLPFYRRITASFSKNVLITLGSCVIFFIGIPGLIYAVSFIPPLAASPEGFTWAGLIQAQKDMFSYHSGLVGSHPFASSWWEWPFMKRPVWYFSGEGDGEGIVSSIVAMGNPLIWWSGIFMMIAVLWLSLKRKDGTAYVIWIAYLAQYVPWMLVTRETFLYHYFAMVPFLILATVYILEKVEENRPKLGWVRTWYTAAAVLLFILFYPVLSGMQVNSEYVERVLRWFPSWLF